MKKRISILFAISAALLTSCAVEPLFEAEGPAGTTTVTFTPSFGTGDGSAATKAFADLPQLENLYLAVFNEGGKALIEYVKAEPVTLATGNGNKCAYTATLKTSGKPRVIHFIANAPEEIGFGSDVDALGSLMYSFDKENWTGEDAYWGYLKLDNGICDENDPGFGSLQNALSNVNLVRNFAKIKVQKADGSNFEITRFWISNFPDCSTAAPYNRDARRFETDYGNYTRVTAAMAAGYMGFRPASSGLVSLSGLDDEKLPEISLAPGASAYTYEREKPTSDPLCIIVGGTSDLSGGSTETFYKIVLRDNDGNYLPILRNFTYTVTIGNVHKVGMPSVEDALNSVASGALDIDISLQGLKDLSNGKSRIAVSETERMLFDDKPFELLYSFIPDVTTGEVVNKTLEQLGKTKEQAETDHDSYVTIDFEPGLSGKVIQSHSVSSTDEIDGYRMVSMTPVPLSDVVKKEVVTVTGHRWNGERYETIQRTVNYQLRPHLDMTLTLTPDEIPEEYTGTITATIGIEENLPKSLFTLDMMITSEQMTLSPGDDKLSISTGVGADGKPAFFISRAITWEEYSRTASVLDADGIRRKHFDCLLKVNTSDFGDVDESFGKGDRILVMNAAFNTGSAFLIVGSDSLKRFITPHLDKEYLVSGKTAAICFGMTSLPADGTITVMMEGMEPVNPATGSGFSDISGSDGVYELTVTGTTVKLDVTPTTPAADSAKFSLEDDEFNPSVEFPYDIQAPAFSDLKFNYNNLDYVVAEKTALACFHMEYLPEGGAVTIHLKNAVPEDVTLTGSDSDSDGFVEYEIPVSGNDVSFPVVISPAAGEDTASFKLTATDFSSSAVAEAPIRKLSFSNLKLINVNNPSKKYVIGGRAARIDFTMDDMPSDNVITIELENLTLGTGRTGVSAVENKGSGKYDLTVTGKHVLLEVTPTAGKTTASYTLTGGEFNDGECAAPIQKLHFQNSRIANVETGDVDLPYLVAGNSARIYITLEEMPSDKKISIKLENLNRGIRWTGVSTVEDKGNGTYDLTVTEKNVLLDVTLSEGATTASYTFTGKEFEDLTVETKIYTRVTIDLRKVHFVTEEDPTTRVTDTYSLAFCDKVEEGKSHFIEFRKFRLDEHGDICSTEDGSIVGDIEIDVPDQTLNCIFDIIVTPQPYLRLVSDEKKLADLLTESQSAEGATIVMK